MQTLSLNSENNPKQNKTCENCGLVNFASIKFCGRCGNPFSQPQASFSHQQTNSYIDLAPRTLLGVIGSVLLFLGVFMPIVSLPIIGNLNYFQNGKGDGVVVLILAGVSLFLTLTGRFRGIFVTAFLSLAVMGVTFFRFQWAIITARSELSKGDNPFKGLGQTLLDTVQLQWGWAVLVVGVGLLITAAFIKGRNRQLAPLMFDRNNIGLYAVLAGAVAIFVGWGFLVAVPQFTKGINTFFAGTGSQSKEKSVTKEEDLSKQRQPLLDVLSVDITDKGFIGADIYAGRVAASISFSIQQSNKSAKDIRGYKGAFIVRDIFDDVITTISYKSDGILPAGQSGKKELYLDYNQFKEPHQKLRSTEMQNLRIEWQPETIIFTDGTGLSLSGEQTFPVLDDKTKNEDIKSAEKTDDSRSLPKSQALNRINKPKIARTDLLKQQNLDPAETELEKGKENRNSRPLTAYEPEKVIVRLPDGMQLLVNKKTP